MTMPGRVRSSNASRYADADGYDDPSIEHTTNHHTTETRRSLVTTEFWVMIAAAAAIMFSAYTDNAFEIDQGWTLVAAIVVGYMLSRGFAKAGSHESYTRRS